jgi:ubiquinone/menaquinone biosynthesis C-methylase UbiE
MIGTETRPARTPPPLAEVQSQYDAHAWRYDLLYSDTKSRIRHALLERPVLAITRRARSVLEIGCGTGRLLRKIPARKAIGIDISAASLRFARAKGLRVLQADAHCLPFAESSFDAVLAATGVLTYLEYDAAFAEFSRVLQRGGRLVVHQFAAHTWSLRNIPTAPELKALHLSSIEELDQPARRAGLVPVRHHFYRTLRIAPYLVPIPAWAPGSLWSHVIAIYERKERRAWR